MATGSLGQLTIDLAANITRFERSLTRAEQLAEKRSRAIKRTFVGLAAGIGGALASFGFVRAIEESLQFADTIGKTADKLGIGTDALQEYRFAAEQTGVSTKALDVGIQRFIRRVGEAAQGQGVLKDVLRELNIELREQDGTMRSTEDILGDYANAIRDAESAQERLRLANKAFDTEGVALVNLLRGGADAIEDYRREAQSLGIVLGEDVIRNSERANDAMNRLNKIIKVGSVEAFGALAPVIEDLADAITSLVTGDFNELPEIVRETIIEFAAIDFFIERVTEGLGALGASAALLISGEWAKIPEVWKESGERSNQATADLDAFIAKLREVNDVSKEIVEGPSGGNVIESIAAGSEGGGGLTDAQRSEIDAEFEYTQKVLADSEKAHKIHNANRLKLERDYSSAKKSLEQGALRNTVGLLTELGRNHEGAAKAAIALQKGLAIAETIMATRAAVMKAYEYYGPTPAGYAAAAGMVALGALNVGLIAATGLSQASNVGSAGGATLGTVSDPITTQDLDTGLAPTFPTSTQGTITINVTGVITEEILQDLVIPAIQDSVENKDVILIRNDSRNALELTS